MEIKHTTKKQWLQAALCMLVAAGLCAVPMLSRDLMAGHDAVFHILRLEALADVIRGGGTLPARVYPMMLGGYGYAAGLFYPDIFLLPAALARAFLLGPEAAFKLHLMLCILAQCVTCYLAARAISRSHFGGCLFLLLYSLCQYHFANLHIRSAVGEVQAMIFIPLVIWGLWDFTEQKAQKPWLLFLGFTGLILSHTVSLALMGLVAVVWVLVRLPRVLNAHAIGGGLSAAAACLLVSGFYWLPMLEQFASDTFKVSEEPLTRLVFNTTTWADLLQPGSFKGVGLGGLLTLAAVLGLCAIRRSRGPAAAWVFLAVGIGLALCTMKWFPWGLVDKTPLTSVQFPWRLNAIGQMFVCLGLTLLCCRALEQAGKAARYGCAALAAVLGAVNLICLVPTLPEQVNYPGNWFTEQRGETFYLVGAEWLPAGVNAQEFAFEPAAQWTDQQGAHIGEYLPNGDFVLDYQGQPGPIGIPKLWYKGYTAELQPLDGSTPIAMEASKDGAGRVELNAGQGLPAGRITVSYTGTLMQRVSDRLSLTCAVLFIGYALYQQGRKRSSENK